MWVVVRSEEILSEEDTKGKFAFFKENEETFQLRLLARQKSFLDLYYIIQVYGVFFYI